MGRKLQLPACPKAAGGHDRPGDPGALRENDRISEMAEWRRGPYSGRSRLDPVNRSEQTEGRQTEGAVLLPDFL